ncbi:roadblock/LC7 domain-containing protein [Streptomyces sp. SPB074]|nr:roadblock/LC7 domain-containing protein [Streptomyces sp. SPB074]
MMPQIDHLLKELDETVEGVHQIVVLSADGLQIARHGGEQDAADRVAAACAGLQSLAAAVGQELPGSQGRMQMVVIEVDEGYFYLMAAGTGAYLAVLAEARTEAGTVGLHMRELARRLGPHLTSPPRRTGTVLR